MWLALILQKKPTNHLRKTMLNNPLGKVVPKCANYGVNWEGTCIAYSKTENSDRKYTPAQRVHPIGKILTPWSRGYTIVHWQNSEHKLKQTMSVRQSVSPSICQSIRPSARPFNCPPILWADTCMHTLQTLHTFPTLQYIALQYITLNYIRLHYITLH